MNDLVRRLTDQEHPVVVGLRPELTVAAFKRALDNGFVHIKFTDIVGGTELGVRLDRERSDLASADFQASAGHVWGIGGFSLRYLKVRGVAEIDMPSLSRKGRLVIVAP